MIKSLMKTFDYSHREYKLIQKIALKVDALKDKMRLLTDEELQAKTDEFKSRVANGESLDDLLFEAFAVVREASKRVTGLYPFLVQIEGAITIHRGNIAEMKTGEGKTLTSVMPAYLNALSGKGTHIITVNEYLAGVGAEEMGQIYNWLGLSVGLNLRSLTKEEKRAAYMCDILYSTNNELGFDYLRDNMVTYKEHRVQRPLNYGIVDEIDSILVDEARTPLIISGGAKKTANLYLLADRFAKNIVLDTHFTYDEKTKAVTLTDEGVVKAEQSFSVDNLYDLKHSALVHHIQQALKANYSMKNDVDYVVQDGEIVIVDQFTGRLMKGRAFSEGLHQAIEAKEKVKIKEETRTLATITYQNFFRMYNKLSGMTGTAKTEEEEFRNIYNMYVIEIPTNEPVIRKDMPDLIYPTLRGKYNAIVDEIARRNKLGQPILVGTIAIETSELISALLTKKRVKHEVLNAKNHAREAEIVQNAGQQGSVTIATNMAGRGTDIKLGEGVIELGGLCVIGTERHESRRIDNQLRGRSGRQGDPGYSQFYVSLEDELMIRFGSENIKDMFSRLGMKEDEAIQSKMVSRAIESSQKRVEGNNFDVRKQLLQYDDVMGQQREIMYNRRNEILDNTNIHNVIIEMVTDTVGNIVRTHLLPEGHLTDNDLEKISEYINQNFLNDKLIKVSDLKDLSDDEVINKILDVLLEQYKEKEEILTEDKFYEFEKVVALRIIDTFWMNHIDTMAHLREGIHLRSYAQQNPLRSYTTEGFRLFDQMLVSIEQDITRYVLKAEIRQNLEREEVEKGQASSGKEKEGKRKPKRSQKVGRNEPCPCGSGKKYKQCCGR